jgi:PAS domain S-box-containing protein
MADEEGFPSAYVAGLVLSSPDAIILTDADGRIVEFNSSAEEMFGWARSAALGRRVGELVVPERFRAAHEAGMARVRAGGERHVIGRRVEMPALRESGEEFACELALSAFDIGGQTLFAAIIRDASGLRAALEEQRRAAAFLQSIFDDQTEVIFRFDADLRLDFANDAAIRLYGQPLQDMRGRHVFEDVEPDVRPRLERELAALTPERPTIRAVDPKRLPGGEVRWLDWTNRALFDAAGRRVGILCVGRDVTETVRAQAEREEAERRFAAFMRHAPVGMYLKDAAGRYVIANPEMEHVFGRPVPEVLGLGARDLLPAELVEVIEAADRDVLENGRSSAIEEHLPGVDRYEWTLVVRFPVPGPEGQEPMIGGFDIDITRIKKAEAELARMRGGLSRVDKMNALGAFAAEVVHELNNPLTILAGQAELLEEEAAGGPLAERAAMICRVVDRCGRIARSFLDVARRPAPERVALDLPGLVGTTLEVVSHALRGAGIEVIRRAGEGLPPVAADPDQLQQALLNLMLNAQQALAEVEGTRRIVVETRAGEDGATAIVEISDTGPGIPDELRARIFEPFYTSKAGAGGTGLGLSISRSAIEAQGGRLVLVPTERGACFRIILPAHLG